MNGRTFLGLSAALAFSLPSSALLSATSMNAALSSEAPLLIAQTGEPRTFTRSEQEEQFKKDEEAMADDRAVTVAEGEMYRQDLGDVEATADTHQNSHASPRWVSAKPQPILRHSLRSC